METARWSLIQELFHEAADLAPSERPEFLKSACGDDDDLARHVAALLENESSGATVLDRNIAQVANEVLAGVPFSEGQRFGHYRLMQWLGEGGMGVVCLAEREDLGSKVAIKILRDAGLSPARRSRFAAEQRLLASLNHPSIARLYDADMLADGTPWFAMEYVDGVSLTEFCRARNCSLRERLQLFRAACEAVQYAHGHAVIHRDLKPSNILVKPDGSVKLLDFGIAKQLDSGEVGPDYTRTAFRLMTPAYAAPEQIQGATVAVHTDVYSLGVILFELLTGRLPFELAGLSPAEAERAIVEQEPEKPSVVARRNTGPISARDGSWPDLDVLCLTAMHKDPQRRYRSAEALIRDIDHFLNGEPLDARPDTWSYRATKFLRRNRRPVAIAAVTALAVSGVVAYFAVRLAIARSEALNEAARTERIQRFMMNLFEGGDAAAGPADSLRVETLLDRGVEQARALDSDPEVQAELDQTLGNIYQKLGKFERAGSLLTAALDLRRKRFGDEHAAVADAMISLGLLRAREARLDEAERLARDGLAISRRRLPPDHPQVAKATAAVGTVLEDRGHYQEAAPVLEQAVMMQSKPGVPEADLAASLTELANTRFYLGDYAESERLNRRALEIDERFYGARHPLVADVLINLGAIEFNLGRFADAERFNRRALEINRGWYGPNHPETASSLTVVAQSIIRQNRLTEAKPLLDEALAIQEHVYGKVHPRVATALNEVGTLALLQKNLALAEASFSRMAEIYRAVYGERHYLLATALANRASVYLEQKRYAEAEASYRDVIQRYTAALSADHVNTGIARLKLGRTFARERRYPEAEREYLTAYDIFRKQAKPPASWMQTARKELRALYQAMNEPEKARGFRD
jgi:serine/threonine-protein kinase